MSSFSVNFYYISIFLSTFILHVNAVNCPEHCKCSWLMGNLMVDCSNRGLTDYPSFDNFPMEHLDLSGNLFTEFPSQLSNAEALNYLDLSNNKIQAIDSDALLGFTSLHVLLLTNNSIHDWNDIHPETLFHDAVNLKRLSLSGNQLESFSYATDQIISESLEILELQKCGIKIIGGDMLGELPNLKDLSLSGNKLTQIVGLSSKSLQKLNLGNCNLQNIGSKLFEDLPNLISLNLSWNTQLRFETDHGHVVTSESLHDLDVSFCNLDDIDLNGLPNLITLNLGGNMIRTIDDTTFASSMNLEVLSLMKNSLRQISVGTFSQLKRLTKIDLSYNEIATVDKNTFRSNDALITLNLSRNVIEQMPKLVSSSLRDISLSWCEIITIDPKALLGLTSIQRLDLSYNLLRDFPGGMRSDTLQKINLSNCRLSVIRNNTFREFPKLTSIHLNSNRFTTAFNSDVFRSNPILDNIWVGDNPWICSCNDVNFIDFYDYLTTSPQKLKDKNNLRCASPHSSYGKTWDFACIVAWHPNENATNGEKVFSTIMISLFVISVCLLLYTCFRKYMKSRKQQQNHREFRRNQDEMMDIRRRNQRILDEEGTPNAPNSFETNLPSYEDAIRMPKPVRPVKSMLDLTESRRSRNKAQRSQTNPNDIIPEEDQDLIMDYSHRFRSEEMLSNRAKERTAPIFNQRRTGDVEHNISGSRRFSIEQSRFPPAHLKSQNLQSAEQIGNFQSYEHSPYTKRKPKIAEIPPFKRATMKVDSVEFLTDPEYEAASKPGSPFARRKPKTPVTPITENFYANLDELGPTIEDHFGAKNKSRSPSIITNDSFYQIIEPEVTVHAGNWSASSSSNGQDEVDLERGKRKKRKNSMNRRASGNFSAVACDSSSSESDPMVIVHKPLKETIF